MFEQKPHPYLGRSETTAIIHNLAYHNAFRKVPEEWLETHWRIALLGTTSPDIRYQKALCATHLEHPTGTLTMIVLAPDDMQFMHSEGSMALARDDFKATPRQPAVMQDGTVIYWSVTDPVLSTRYAVRWTWKQRVPAAKVVTGR